MNKMLIIILVLLMLLMLGKSGGKRNPMDIIKTLFEKIHQLPPSLFPQNEPCPIMSCMQQPGPYSCPPGQKHIVNPACNSRCGCPCGPRMICVDANAQAVRGGRRHRRRRRGRGGSYVNCCDF